MNHIASGTVKIRLTLDEAHREIRHALLLARRIKRHDVHVAEPGDRPRLFQKVGHHVGAAQVRAMHDLDRHVTFQRRFDRLENLTHAALAELFQDEIGSHLGTCGK
jgi:hypothetical protein